MAPIQASPAGIQIVPGLTRGNSEIARHGRRKSAGRRSTDTSAWLVAACSYARRVLSDDPAVRRLNSSLADVELQQQTMSTEIYRFG